MNDARKAENTISNTENDTKSWSTDSSTMLTPAKNLPNIDCNNSEVKKLLDLQSKSRPSSPNPTYADNMTSMDVIESLPFADDQNDIQKAINMSLQSQIKTNKEQEEEDLKRALEESMMMSQEPPHNAPRNNDPIVIPDDNQLANPPRHFPHPAGLKNVGSSCWYNAVVQVLYYVPSIRRLILQAKVSNPCEEFSALERTFALMKSTKCSWIDPLEFVKLFRAKMPTASTQQDATEFIGILLNYLEEELKPVANGSEKNPLTDLYSGRISVVGKDADDKEYSRAEEFGPHLNIHVQNKPSLELALEGIETNKESWFTELPPVLLFNLNRFTFNKEKKCGEKLHNRLEFRETLYMDRYMRDNRDRSKDLYRQRKKLDDQLDTNELMMKRLIYRENNFNIRVPDALKCVIDLANEYTSKSAELPESDSANLPLPGQLSRDQMVKIEQLLKPWADSIEKEHQTLKSEASARRQERRDLYNFPEYQTIKYMLNGVIIHQGEAGAGHYWAYVKDNREQWWRCNDNEIKKSEYFEIEREGYGGSENGSSAYILIYQLDQQYEKDAAGCDGELTKPQVQAVEAHDSLHLEQLHGVQTANSREALPDLIDNTDHYVMDDPPQVMEVDSTQSDMPMVIQENKGVNSDSYNQNHVVVNVEEITVTWQTAYEKFHHEYEKKMAMDEAECRSYREPNIKKSHFITSLELLDQRNSQEKLKQQFLHFLHDFGTEDAHYFLKGLLREAANSELYYKLESAHNYIAALFDDLILSYDYIRENRPIFECIRQVDSQNRDLDTALTSVEKIDNSLWCLRNYNHVCKDLFKRGFKAGAVRMDDLHFVLEEVLRHSTDVITSHIESTNEERALFKRLGSYRNIFVYLSQDIDNRVVQDWSEESDNSATKVIEQVRNSWCSYIGNNDAICDQDTLSTFIQELFTDSEVKRPIEASARTSMEVKLSGDEAMKRYHEIFCNKH